MALICPADAPSRWLFDRLPCIDQQAATRFTEALTVASVVMAAGFGLMALFTSYKDKEGKTTRYGRLAAFGVVLTALVSLTLNTVKGEIDGVKAEAQRKQQDERFDKTLKGFTDVLARQDQALTDGAVVRANLERSLAGQRRQLAAQRDQIALSQGVSRGLADSVRVSQANADALLRSVWDASDTVSLRDLSVRAHLACGFGNGPRPGGDFAALRTEDLKPAFSPDVTVRIKVLPRASLTLPAEDLELEPDAVGKCPIALRDRCDESLPLAVDATSTEHTLVVAPSRAQVAPRVTGANWRVEQVSSFANFTARTAGLTRRSDWNGVIVQVGILAPKSPFTRMLTNNPDDDRVAAAEA